MILIAAMLFSFSMSCAVWLVVVRRSQVRRLIVQRIGSDASTHSAAGVEESIDSFLKNIKQKSKATTLENMKSDRIAHDLFLAGISDPKIVQFYHVAVKLSAGIPIILVVIDAVTGHLTLSGALKDGLFGLGLFIAVLYILKAGKDKRQKAILRKLPQFLDLLVVCVEAGLGFASALERILKEIDPNDTLTKELSLMYHEYISGLSLAQACQRTDQRCQVNDLSQLLTSIVQSDQMGSSLGNNLRMQAAELRDKYKQRMRTKALKIPIKILFPMMFIFLAFMVLNFAIIGYQMTKVLGGAELGQVKHAL